MSPTKIYKNGKHQYHARAYGLSEEDLLEGLLQAMTGPKKAVMLRAGGEEEDPYDVTIPDEEWMEKASRIAKFLEGFTEVASTLPIPFFEYLKYVSMFFGKISDWTKKKEATLGENLKDMFDKVRRELDQFGHHMKTNFDKLSNKIVRIDYAHTVVDPTNALWARFNNLFMNFTDDFHRGAFIEQCQKTSAVDILALIKERLGRSKKGNLNFLWSAITSEYYHDKVFQPWKKSVMDHVIHLTFIHSYYAALQIKDPKERAVEMNEMLLIVNDIEALINKIDEDRKVKNEDGINWIVLEEAKKGKRDDKQPHQRIPNILKEYYPWHHFLCIKWTSGVSGSTMSLNTDNKHTFLIYDTDDRYLIQRYTALHNKGDAAEKQATEDINNASNFINQKEPTADNAVDYQDPKPGHFILCFKFEGPRYSVAQDWGDREKSKQVWAWSDGVGDSIKFKDVLRKVNAYEKWDMIPFWRINLWEYYMSY